MVLVKRLCTRLFWTLPPPIFVVFSKIVHTTDLDVAVAPVYQQGFMLLRTQVCFVILLWL